MDTDRKKEKLASIIREEAARFIEENRNSGEGTLVTVTRVEIAPDGRNAYVYVSLFPLERVGAFLAEMRHEEHEFTEYVRKNFRMKKIPSIHFTLDDTQEKREEIEKLLEEGEK